MLPSSVKVGRVDDQIAASQLETHWAIACHAKGIFGDQWPIHCRSQPARLCTCNALTYQRRIILAP